MKASESRGTEDVMAFRAKALSDRRSLIVGLDRLFASSSSPVLVSSSLLSLSVGPLAS